jgi:uncharacterized radical SAM superfamily Fe-S cluster-containing enzyme
MARNTVKKLRSEGLNVAWISIANHSSGELLTRSSKHTLGLRFDDITDQNNPNAISKRHVRRIKNFVCNHHKNMKEKYVLVINCEAGISRSAAVGKYCEYVHNIPVANIMAPFPNKLVLLALAGYTNPAAAQYAFSDR